MLDRIATENTRAGVPEDYNLVEFSYKLKHYLKHWAGCVQVARHMALTLKTNLRNAWTWGIYLILKTKHLKWMTDLSVRRQRQRLELFLMRTKLWRDYMIFGFWTSIFNPQGFLWHVGEVSGSYFAVTFVHSLVSLLCVCSALTYILERPWGSCCPAGPWQTGCRPPPDSASCCRRNKNADGAGSCRSPPLCPRTSWRSCPCCRARSWGTQQIQNLTRMQPGGNIVDVIVSFVLFFFSLFECL